MTDSRASSTSADSVTGAEDVLSPSSTGVGTMAWSMVASMDWDRGSG